MTNWDWNDEPPMKEPSAPSRQRWFLLLGIAAIFFAAGGTLWFLFGRDLGKPFATHWNRHIFTRDLLAEANGATRDLTMASDDGKATLASVCSEDSVRHYGGWDQGTGPFGVGASITLKVVAGNKPLSSTPLVLPAWTKLEQEHNGKRHADVSDWCASFNQAAAAFVGVYPVKRVFAYVVDTTTALKMNELDRVRGVITENCSSGSPNDVILVYTITDVAYQGGRLRSACKDLSSPGNVAALNALLTKPGNEHSSIYESFGQSIPDMQSVLTSESSSGLAVLSVDVFTDGIQNVPPAQDFYKDRTLVKSPNWPKLDQTWSLPKLEGVKILLHPLDVAKDDTPLEKDSLDYLDHRFTANGAKVERPTI